MPVTKKQFYQLVNIENRKLLKLQKFLSCSSFLLSSSNVQFPELAFHDIEVSHSHVIIAHELATIGDKLLFSYSKTIQRRLMMIIRLTLRVAIEAWLYDVTWFARDIILHTMSRIMNVRKNHKEPHTYFAFVSIEATNQLRNRYYWLTLLLNAY